MRLLSLLFVFIIAHSSGAEFKYNFVQCSFEKIEGQWIYIFSSSYTSSFTVPVGEQYPLGYIWWRNPQSAKYQETALCSHVDRANADGTLDVRSTVENSDYFADILNSFDCTWETESSVLQVEKRKTLDYGEALTYTYERDIPSKNKVLIVNYLPTLSEVAKMDPFLAEEICFRFDPSAQ